MNKQHDYQYLKVRIKGCKTVDDTYVIFNEISDYLQKYEVTELTYKKLFDKCMDKYNELR